MPLRAELGSGSPPGEAGGGRRHDLDWMRVLLLLLLLPIHGLVAFAVPAIFGAAPSARPAADSWVYPFLLWTHGWRSAALFLVAGAVSVLALRRNLEVGAGVGAFVGRRARRLLKPLVAGGGLLVATVWAVTGAPAMPLRMDAGALWPLLGHLWFLANLALYTLLCLPLLAMAARGAAPAWLGGALAAATLAADMGLRSVAHGAAGGGWEFFWYWGCFAIGAWFVGAEPRAGPKLRAAAPACAVFGVLSAFALIALELAERRAPGPPGALDAAVLGAVHSFHAAAWIAVFYAALSRLRARASAVLSRLNAYVFPVYVLHLPVQIVCMEVLQRFSLDWRVQATLLIGVTAGATTLLAATLGSVRRVRPWIGLAGPLDAAAAASPGAR